MYKYAARIIVCIYALLIFVPTFVALQFPIDAEDSYQTTESYTPLETSVPLAPIEEPIVIEHVEYVYIDISEPDDYSVSDYEIELIAEAIFREGNDTDILEKAGVAWTIFNRYDRGDGTIEEIVKSGQIAWDSNSEITEDNLYVAKDVYERWKSEKEGVVDSGRVLPANYYWYHGDGHHNYFRAVYEGPDVVIWNWGLPNPYAEGE